MILLDISTSYGFRAMKPMGLLRVEHEVIRAFQEIAHARDVVFGFYDQERGKYFAIQSDCLEREVLTSQWKDDIRVRKQTAGSKWARRKNATRFLWRLVRLRGQKATPKTDPDLYLKVQIANALLAIDLHEYSTARRLLGFLARIRPRMKSHLEMLDLLNHQVNFGLFDFSLCEKYASQNEIDLSQVTRYVSVGGFWSDDRHKVGYEIREKFGATVHYLIYDLVPCKWRQVTEPTTKETFPAALHWVLWGVDQIWTISRTTQNDLTEYVAKNGYPDLPADWVRPVYLGSEVPTPTAPETHSTVLARYGLSAGNFVLMVGTIEPRKNHEFAYRMWKELNRRNPGDIPPLVIVGQIGWHNEAFMHLIKEDAELPHDAIRMYSSVEDSDLAALYANCKFSLYPSQYEGWGLPVVESLAFGKPCLCSDAPSLVEAGQGISEHISLFDGEQWLERLSELVTDPAALTAAEAKTGGFVSISWQSFKADLIADFSAFCDKDAPVPEMTWDTWDQGSTPDIRVAS